MSSSVVVALSLSTLAFFTWLSVTLADQKLQDACKQIGMNNRRFIAIYNECPPQCVAIRHSWSRKRTEQVSFTLDEALKTCGDLAKASGGGLYARVVRFAGADDYIPIVSQFIPSISFFVGAKRTSTGVGWDFADYSYLTETGEADGIIDELPSSFVYTDIRTTGEVIDPQSLQCLKVTCSVDENSSKSRCQFARSSCRQSEAVVCQVFSTASDKENDEERQCFTCKNGDLEMKLRRNMREIVSAGYPVRVMADNMECVSVITSGDKDFKPMINVTAKVGCLTHVDDFVEIYHEKDRVSDAQLVARLRTESSLSLVVPSNVLIRYHSATMVTEYTTPNGTGEMFVQPSIDQRRRLQLIPVTTLSSPLSDCDEDSPRGFKVELTATSKTLCPKMFYGATWRWTIVNITAQHIRDNTIDCTLVITAPRNRSVVVNVIESNLKTGNVENGDSVTVHDGYEMVQEPIIQLRHKGIPGKSGSEYMAFGNVTNATATDRAVIFIRLTKSANVFGSIKLEYRQTSRKFAHKQWRTGKETRRGQQGGGRRRNRKRPDGSWWHFWRREGGRTTRDKQNAAGGIFALVAVLILLAGVAGTVLFAYYRRWPVCLRLASVMGTRKLFEDETVVNPSTTAATNGVTNNDQSTSDSGNTVHFNSTTNSDL